MAMVVRSNMNAMNANRNLSINNGQVAKSLEKLASGYAINRAGDDASGLAISEKMKAQIKGLEQASDNAQDGISLVQTAEGGMNEIHDMLNRMVELATKSANGTIQDEVDREAIQSEVDALRSEIDRIADATNFNGIDLLNGSMDGDAAGGAAAIENITATGSSAATDASMAAITGTTTAGSDYELVITALIDGEAQTFTFTATATGTTVATVADQFAAQAAEDELFSSVFTMDETTGAIAVVETGSGAGAQLLNVSSTGAALTIGTVVKGTDAGTVYTATTSSTWTVDGQDYAITTDASLGGETDEDGVTHLYADSANTAGTLMQKTFDEAGLTTSINAAAVTVWSNTLDSGEGGAALTLQVGDTYDDFNKVSVNIQSMKCDSLSIDKLSVSTEEDAGDSIQVIKDAINMVSENRANLGALQNRLEYTINNLDNTAENMTSANSTIRDTDMASEMMEYTKMNVLVQSAQSMLAQANQAPQQVLSLLG